MRRNLQSKFNLLGVTLIVFSLLMVPMFNQVKADTRGSIKEAKNTWMSKMFREVAKDFKPRNLEDTEVEDYWAEQAKKQDPNCGDACDPNADRDGDGMSNGDEVRAGRNPSCNEDKEPHPGYCKDQDPYNLTEPDPVVTKIERQLLLNHTWEYNVCSGGQPIAFNACAQQNFAATGNITKFEIYFNATWRGTSYNGEIRGGPNNAFIDNYGGSASTGNRQPTQGAEVERPSPGQYRATLNLQGVQSGTWQLQVYAHVVK